MRIIIVNNNSGEVIRETVEANKEQLSKQRWTGAVVTTA